MCTANIWLICFLAFCTSYSLTYFSVSHIKQINIPKKIKIYTRFKNSTNTRHIKKIYRSQCALLDCWYQFPLLINRTKTNGREHRHGRLANPLDKAASRHQSYT